MRKLYLPIIAGILFAFPAKAQVINIPDANFKARLLAADVTNNTAQDSNNNNMKIDADGNGEIEQNEALLVYRLFYTVPPPLRMAGQNQVQTPGNPPIADLTGISYFSNLRKLDVAGNQLVSADFSELDHLDYLDCSGNNLNTLNVAGLGSLAFLKCSNNNLTELDLAGDNELVNLYCDNNQITSLDVYGLEDLFVLYCDNNQITDIQFGNNNALEWVYCGFNQLTQIDISDTAAYLLHCNDNPNLADINIKNGVASALTFQYDPVPFPIDSFDFTNLPALQSLCCDTGEQSVVEQVLTGTPVAIATDCVPAIIYIADATFKNALLHTNCVDSNNNNLPDTDADADNDGEIQVTEALAITRLYLDNRLLTTIEGIAQFANLEKLYVSSNQLAAIDVSAMVHLETLECNDNALVGLAIPDHLRALDCSNNDLASLDVSNTGALYSLSCSHNELTSLLLPVSDLTELDFSYNNITVIDVSQYGLYFLNAAYNQLDGLDFSNSSGKLLYLDISGNLYTDMGPIETDGYFESDVLCNDTRLTSLDLSQSEFMIHLEIRNNPDLQTINLHNGDIDVPCVENPDGPCRIQNIIENNPALAALCVDDNEVASFETFLNNPEVMVTSDCGLLAAANFGAGDDFILFPNPVNDILQLRTTSGKAIENISIYSTTGQLLADCRHCDAIDVSGLARGCYFARITTDSGQYVHRFLKS